MRRLADEARFVIQSAALRRVLGSRQLEEPALTSEAAKAYAAFLDSFLVYGASHMDLDSG